MVMKQNFSLNKDNWSTQDRDTSTVPRIFGNKLLKVEMEVEDIKVKLRIGKKEKRILYSPSFFVKTLQRKYIKLFPPSSLTNMGAETTKIKSIRKILSKRNNHSNHRTLADRRDLEEHQERSRDNDIGQQIRYSIEIQ